MPRFNQYTRYLTVALRRRGDRVRVPLPHAGALPRTRGRLVLIVVTLTAARCFLIVFGELITKRGVGNGISILIFASILTSMPTRHQCVLNGGAVEKLFFPLIAIGIVVPLFRAGGHAHPDPVREAHGRPRQTQGGATYMPLRVNMAGVIPVIFAARCSRFRRPSPRSRRRRRPGSTRISRRPPRRTSSRGSADHHLHLLLYASSSTRSTRPTTRASTAATSPASRPGPPTAQYLDRVLTRLTLRDRCNLAVVAVLPSVFINHFGFSQATSRALGAPRC